MKTHPDDPRITDYVLGELAPDEAAAVERAAAEDPAVSEQIRETREIQRFLTERLATPALQLLPRQHENVRRSARRAGEPNIEPRFAALRRWSIPLAAAATLVLAATFLVRGPAPQPRPVAAATPPPPSVEIAELIEPPAPVAAIPPPPPPPAPILPAVPRLGLLATAEFPRLELPIQDGKPGLDGITQAILADGKLPPRESVRLEEILNHFPLRLTGTAAIARSAATGWHPDQRDSGMSAHVATLATELIACPWKPSACLLLISLRANEQNDCDVRLAYHPDPANVLRYRLLGFNPADGRSAENPPTRLRAGSYTTLAVEIEPSNPSAALGSLEWSTEDKAAPPISLRRKADAEPSDDARFATLVCTYGQWLAGESSGLIDREIVAALAREIASATLPFDRAEFLVLIEKSLRL